MYNQVLGLDEALITVDGSAIVKKLKEIDVYFQISECFGCLFDKLKTLSLNSTLDFIVSTKHKLSLELRNSEDNSTLCEVSNLELNNHGHYKISFGTAQSQANELNITSVNSTNSKYLNYKCNLETIDGGSCILCPLAIAITLLSMVIIGEKLILKFVIDGRGIQSRRQTVSTNHDGSLKRISNSTNINNVVEIEKQKTASNSTDQIARATDPPEVEGSLSSQGSQIRTGSPIPTVEAIYLQSGNETTTRQQRSSISSEKRVKIDNKKSGPCRKRIDSLDAFRGLTIAGMIMVNYGGAGYWALEHAAWDGITPADFVFPFFIFLMGASIAISTKSMIKRGLNFNQMLLKIIKRSVLLMALGLCLNSKWLNGNSLHYLRLTGVLQRFSISYLVVAIMFAIELIIGKWLKSQSLYRLPLVLKALMAAFEILTALNFLCIYIYITFYFEFDSNCPNGYIGPGGATEGGKYAHCTGGAAAWLDRRILGLDHIYNDRNLKQIFKTEMTHDPEGLLGNTTSILLTMMGLQCGKILIRYQDDKKRIYSFFLWLSILAIACVNMIIIPVNKRLWSLTFVTVTGSSAFLVIIILYFVVDIYKCNQTFILKLLISGGKNSIFLYVGHSLLSGMLPWYFPVNEASHFQLLLRLIWSTFLWLLVAHYMASKKLFIRL